MVVAMLVMGEVRLPGCHTCEARNIGPTKVPNNEKLWYEMQRPEAELCILKSGTKFQLTKIEG
jgi:hypothetical protein